MNKPVKKPKTIEELIERFCPCPNGWRWLQKQESLASAWEACHRPDWMTWLLDEIGMPDQARLGRTFPWSANPGRKADREAADKIRAAVPNPFRPKPRSARKPAGAKKQEVGK